MENQFQLFSGHFHKAKHFVYDRATKQVSDYGTEFRFKQKEVTQKDFSTGKESIRTQDTTGRVYVKRSFSISTISTLPFKVNDKITISNEEKKYTIISISEGYDSITAMGSLQFNDLVYPRILELE